MTSLQTLFQINKRLWIFIYMLISPLFLRFSAFFFFFLCLFFFFIFFFFFFFFFLFLLLLLLFFFFFLYSLSPNTLPQPQDPEPSLKARTPVCRLKCPPQGQKFQPDFSLKAQMPASYTSLKAEILSRHKYGDKIVDGYFMYR